MAKEKAIICEINKSNQPKTPTPRITLFLASFFLPQVPTETTIPKTEGQHNDVSPSGEDCRLLLCFLTLYPVQ